jgi:hypothetical protein
MSYLDFLIQDCLREYENGKIQSAIDLSTAQSTRSDNSIVVPLLLEQKVFPASPVIAVPSSFRPADRDDLADVSLVFPKQTLF